MDEILEVELKKKSDEFHNRIRSILLEIEKIHLQPDAEDKLHKLFHELKLIINGFEPLPTSLDLHLDWYIDKLVDIYMIQYQINKKSNLVTQNIGETVYYFSKIRGFKIITNYFSSDIYLIPRLIELLSKLNNDHEIFLNLMWLSNLVLVPFNLDLIQTNLPAKLFEIGIYNLEKHSNASKNQLVSSILLSRLISRQDLLKINWLQKYFDVLRIEWDKPPESNGAVKSGHLLTINKILKRCPLEEMDRHLPFLLDIIQQDLNIFRFFNSNFTNLNILYLIKVLSKIARIYILKGDYHQVSNIINSLVHDIMNFMSDQFDTTLRYAMAKSLSSICLNLEPYATNYLSQLIDYLLNQLEIVDLTKEFYEITIDNNQIDIAKYHTILLFIGYISLNKTLPNSFIPQILSIANRTLFIEQQKFNYTIGSQLRDSSCFIVWSLCRLIKKENFKTLWIGNPSMMETIFLDLILVTIFDSELILRRCGVAVIQEFLGRFGSLMFTHGTPEQIGTFIIDFVGLFSNNEIGSHSQSYLLILQLVQLGFDKNLFISTLLDKITNGNIKFPSKILCSEYLKTLMTTTQENPIRFNVKSSTKFTQELVLSRLRTAENSIYFVSDFLTYVKDEIAISAVIDQGESFNFDWQYDSVEKALGYLKWLQLLQLQDRSITNWQTLFNILKLEDIGLVEPFRQYFRKLEIMDNEIFYNLLNCLKKSSIILSHTIFYFQHYNDKQLFELIEVLWGSVGCEIKANMIYGLQSQLDNFPSLDVDSLLELLDDYTITNQGDVGSKVRLATLRLIKQHQYCVENTTLMNRKLLRLSGEMFDKIKFEAFSLLTDNTSLHELSISEYYGKLFTYYNQIDSDEELRLDFWRGVSFSLGALTGNSSIIKYSFREFIKFYMQLSNSNRLDVLNKIAQLLKVDGDLTKSSSRRLNLYNTGLNLFVKIFEASIPIPNNFNYNGLFIRGYNLHINTANVSRIGLVLKIFQHLALVDDRELQGKVRRRIAWVSCYHKLEIVRLLASEALFEVVNQINPSRSNALSEIDWMSSPSQLKSYIPRLQNLLNVSTN